MRKLDDLDLPSKTKDFLKMHGCKTVNDIVEFFAMFRMDLPEDVFSDVIGLMRESENS